MAVTLGANQYGKAETRVVRVFRDTEPHEIVDYNVSVQLRGDFADVHLHGDNTKCLTTDATKNTVNAFAKEMGDAVREPESFGMALARHFVDDVPQVDRARIQIEAYPWDRLSHNGQPAPACLRPARRLRPHGHRHLRRPTRPGSSPACATSGAQDHRLGVPHLLLRPLHHARAHRRPDHGQLGDRAVAAHRRRTWTGARPTTRCSPR